MFIFIYIHKKNYYFQLDAQVRNNINERRILQRRYGPQTSRGEPLRFLGERNGTMRRNQLGQLRDIYQDRENRGRVYQIVPCPPRIENPM